MSSISVKGKYLNFIQCSSWCWFKVFPKEPCWSLGQQSPKNSECQRFYPNCLLTFHLWNWLVSEGNSENYLIYYSKSLLKVHLTSLHSNKCHDNRAWYWLQNVFIRRVYTICQALLSRYSIIIISKKRQ